MLVGSDVGSSLLLAELPDSPLFAVGIFAALAALAYSARTSWAGGAAIVLLLLGGDPDEREASGAAPWPRHARRHGD